MEEKLREYVVSLFSEAPMTKKTIEVREEILTNVLERYQDLLASGATPEEAFEISKRSIGNLGEIVKTLDEPDNPQTQPLWQSVENPEIRRRRSLCNGISTALFILSPVFVIVCSVTGSPILGVCLLIAAIAIGVGIRVYASGAYRVETYQRMDDSVVEEFKEWRSSREETQRKIKMYEGILWPLVVAVYFLVSFMTMAWYITWIIFLIGAAANQLMKIMVEK